MKKLILFSLVALLATACSVEQQSIEQKEAQITTDLELNIGDKTVMLKSPLIFAGKKLEGLTTSDYVARLVLILESGEVVVAEEKYLGKDIELTTNPKGDLVPLQDYGDIFAHNTLGLEENEVYMGQKILARIPVVTNGASSDNSGSAASVAATCSQIDYLWFVYKCHAGPSHIYDPFKNGCWMDANRLPSTCTCMGSNSSKWPCTSCLSAGIFLFLICEYESLGST